MSSFRREDGPGKKQLELLVKGIQGKVAKVGWLHREQYIKGIPVAYVAAIQEYGCPEKNIPARPYFRTTILEHEKEWKSLMRKGALAIMQGSETDYSVMEKIGLKVAGDVRKTISNIWSPALAKSTVLARLRRNSATSRIKGRVSEEQLGNLTKPLVDSGFMLATLTNVVEDDPGV